MFKEIISLPKTKYLGFGIMMPWENNLEIQFDLWKDAHCSGEIARLKEICRNDQVLGIFCYRCDMDTRTFSYHIACENKSNVDNSEYEELTLESLTFARFESECVCAEQRFEVYQALCDEIWGEWLPTSDYISLIEPETFGCVKGYASLERYTSKDQTNDSFGLEIWLPIKKK